MPQARDHRFGRMARMNSGAAERLAIEHDISLGRLSLQLIGVYSDRRVERARRVEGVVLIAGMEQRHRTGLYFVHPVPRASRQLQADAERDLVERQGPCERNRSTDVAA